MLLNNFLKKLHHFILRQNCGLPGSLGLGDPEERGAGIRNPCGRGGILGVVPLGRRSERQRAGPLLRNGSLII